MDREAVNFPWVMRQLDDSSLGSSGALTHRALRGRTVVHSDENTLLAVLPSDVWSRLAGQLKPITYQPGTVLDARGELLNHLVFPCTCVVALTREMIDGASPEVGLVGREGVVGMEQLMGGASPLNRAVVRIGGTALCLAASVVHEEFGRGGAFQIRLLRFMQALITQVAQTAVCKRLHSIEHDLCRWLLLLHDRSGSERLSATHEQIAATLGVRREGVTLALGRLQASRFINSSRGHISIINRNGLEQHTCECYRLICAEYDRLISPASQRVSAARSQSLREPT